MEVNIYNIVLVGCENKTQLDISEGPNVNRIGPVLNQNASYSCIFWFFFLAKGMKGEDVFFSDSGSVLHETII